MIKLNSKINKSNVIKLVNIEVTSLNTSLNSQKILSKQILVFLKSFIGNVEVDSIFSDEITKFLSNSSFYLSQINSNINSYNNLLDILDNIKFNVPTTEYSNTVSKITQYNKKSEETINEIFKKTADVHKFILSMSSIDISEYISIDSMYKIDELISENNKSTNEESQKSSRKKKDAVSLIDNTLTISEVDGLVTLPYKTSELKKVLRNNPDMYSSLSDIILSEYTIPIKNYKFSAIARFREAYKLVIEREKRSKKEALLLAMELFSNYNLHPAIITACKDLNELDVYLSCLEFNELDDFHFFKIVYDSVPVVVKKNKSKEVIA